MSTSQNIPFKFSGLDTDSAPEYMQPGDSRYRKNCINDSTDDDLLGDIQSIKGTTQYTHSVPAGVNITIGWCQDVKENAIIHFVYNSTGEHQIRRFYPDTNTDELILQSPLLNFQQNYQIFHANVINGLLYWTDGWFQDYEFGVNNLLNYNPPRKINIQKAIDGDPGYGTLTFETLDRIKYQPAFPPTLRYACNAANPYNYIFGKMFQMAYRYIYDDKEKSTWSSLSRVLLPAYNYKNPNIGSTMVTQWENAIEVTFETGSEIVTDIEIAIREQGTYYIIARLNKDEEGYSSNTTATYTYDGIALKENLLQEDYLRPFDYVPQISSCQEIANGRMVDANLVENYDKTEVNLSLEFIRYFKSAYTRDTSPLGAGPAYGVPWIYSGGIGSLPAADVEYPLCTFKSDGVYQVGIVYYDRAGRSSLVDTKEEYIARTPMYDVDADPFGGMWMDPLKLRVSLNHTPPVWAKYYQIVLTKELSYKKKTMFAISAFNFDSLISSIILPETLGYTFEEGDHIRFIATNTVPTASLGLDYPIFDTSYNCASNNQGRLPWADSSGNYEDSLFGSSTVALTDVEIQEYDAATNRIYVRNTDVDGWLNAGIRGYRELFGASSNRFFIVEIYNKNRNETDNKIFHEVGEKYAIGDAYTSGRYHTGSVQDQIPGLQPAIVDIFGFDAYIRFKKQTSQLQNFFENLIYGTQYGYSGITGGDWSVPYLPSNQNSLYGALDLSQCIPLLTSTHAPIPGTICVFSYLNSFDGGPSYYNFDINPDPGLPRPDIYGFTINGPVEFCAFVEDSAFADDFPSEVYNDGRPNSNLETLGRKEYISRLRWSGKLFENTLTNDLSTVYFDSYKDLSETYNQISRIRQVGDTLKVRQKSKMTSFYLDKEMLNVDQGSDQVGQSNTFLSAPNIYEEEYGTIWPGSDSSKDRTSYFLDTLRDVVIRDSGNKPLPISGDPDNPKDVFRMSKYFRTLCAGIRALGNNVRVISCWDDFSKLYTLTVKNLTDVGLQSQTIVFHEPTNRWKSFMSYIPEMYGTIGQHVVGFVNSQPNVHYTNALRNNFYGVQYDQEMRVMVNVAGTDIKVFDHMEIIGNKPWDCPTITITPTVNYPSGMLSKIPKTSFQAIEGTLCSSFYGDMNDPDYTNAVIAAAQGRRLRGKTMEITMVNNETSLVYCSQINVYVTPSEI